MGQKKFDLDVIKRIKLLIQENADDDSPFEWFVIGFLYAHPNNVQSLDKVFLAVHRVISLKKTNQLLRPEDTHEMLIRMINNQINSETNLNISKEPEITLSSDNEKQKTKVGKSSPSKSKAKPLVINADSPILAEVNKKPETLGVSKSTRIPEEDDISYDSEEQFKPRKTRSSNNNSVQNSEDLFKDNKSKRVSAKKSPIKSSESLISSLKPKDKDKTSASNKNSTTKEPPKQFDIFEDDISFESDNDLKSSKTKVLTRSAQKQQEQKKPSTSKAKLATTPDKSPVRTPNKGGFKFTNSPPEPKPVLQSEYLEDDHSYESENNLLEISMKKEPTPNKSGKTSLIKEEQEVDHRFTFASIAKRLHNTNGAKETPKAESKKSGDTEDIFVSEPEEAKSLIARQAQVKAGKKSVDKKSTGKDLIEEEFNGRNSFSSDKAKLISKMEKKSGTPNKNFDILSQKKQKAVRLDDMVGDLILSLEDDTPIEQDILMNSRFKKQRVHQADEFEKTLEIESKVKEAPSMSRKPKRAQLIDDSECIQLEETPPGSPKHIYFTKKSANKDPITNEIELIEEPVVFTRKPIDKVQVDQPKSAKELRDARRFMSPEDEEKLSKQYIEQLQMEERKAANKRKKQ